MYTVLKKMMRNLLDHKDDIDKYIDTLYQQSQTEDDLNEIFGELKNEGLITYFPADNRVYNIRLTLKGKNLSSKDLSLSEKEEFLDLIEQINGIERLFHKKDNQGECIYDVPKFQDWLQQVLFYLQRIQDRGNDHYIRETIFYGKHWSGVDDRIKYNIFSGRLRSIEKNIDMYYDESCEKNIDLAKSDKLITNKKYDVFISHANKDKIDYVEDLYQEITKLGINIFYDKETFEWGDNWKEKIIEGVDNSEFAIIVISNNFFGREWTEKELRLFLNKQNESGVKIVLPLLYKVSIDDLCKNYPELGDIQAINDKEYDLKDVAIMLARQLLKRFRNC